MFQSKVFMFDRVLRPNVTQEYVYTVTAKPIVAGKYCTHHVHVWILLVLVVAEILT